MRWKAYGVHLRGEADGVPFCSLPRRRRTSYFFGMSSTRLIDAIVRQTTVLLATLRHGLGPGTWRSQACVKNVCVC
jgi:hypothetical protein